MRDGAESDDEDEISLWSWTEDEGDGSDEASDIEDRVLYAIQHVSVPFEIGNASSAPGAVGDGSPATSAAGLALSTSFKGGGCEAHSGNTMSSAARTAYSGSMKKVEN